MWFKELVLALVGPLSITLSSNTFITHNATPKLPLEALLRCLCAHQGRRLWINEVGLLLPSGKYGGAFASIHLICDDIAVYANVHLQGLSAAVWASELRFCVKCFTYVLVEGNGAELMWKVSFLPETNKYFHTRKTTHSLCLLVSFPKRSLVIWWPSEAFISPQNLAGQETRLPKWNTSVFQVAAVSHEMLQSIVTKTLT